MKNDYPNLTRPLFKKGFFVLSFLMAFFFLGLSTAESQTLINNGPLCAGNQLILTYTTAGCGATSVTFTGPGGYSQTRPVSSGQAVATRSNVIAGWAGVYTATPNNAPTCPVLTTTVVVNALPLTPTISGAKDLCGLNNVVDYTIEPYVLTGHTANWSVAGGNAVITAGQGTNTITVNWGNASPTGSVNVTITNTTTGCFVTTTNYIVNIWSEPQVYNVVTDPVTAEYCYGESGVKIGLDDQEWNNVTPVTYVLKEAGVPIAWHTPVLGDDGPFWFNISGNEYFVDNNTTFTVEAQTLYCNQFQNGTVSPEVYNVVTADAGNGGQVCSDNLALDAFTFGGTLPVDPATGGTWAPTYGWTYTGPGVATFVDDEDPATSVKVDTYGEYTFTWSVTNGPCEDSEDITVFFYEKPAVGFSFNDELAGTGSEFNYCFDETVTVTLSEIWYGTAPFTIKWTVNGVNEQTATDVELDDVLFSQILDAGEYIVQITEITDVNGCSPTSVAPYNAKVIIHPEPAVGFSFNGNLAGTNSEFEYCYDETVTVTLSTIWSGTAPFDIDWTVDGVSSSLDDVELNDELFSNILAVGEYTIQITSIVDANGCSPSTYAPYVATVIINEEPSLLITVDGNNVASTTLEYCYDDDIVFTIAGDDGVERWTFDWQVEYEAGGIVSGFQFTGDWVDNTSETKTFSASALVPGEYVVKITALEDGNGCVASAATLAGYYINLIISPEPVVTAISLVYDVSPTLISPVSVTGDLASGYEMCINENDDYYYFGVSALTAADDLEKDFNNPFYLDETSVPPGFYAYWAARGVDGGGPYGDWRDLMWQVINGNAPMFNLVYDSTDYYLYDGLQGAPNILRINGDYFPGLYTFEGSVKSDDGCFSDVSVKIEFIEDPNADAGEDYTVCNSTTYKMAAVASVGDGEWTYTGPGIATFVDDTYPLTDVTVDVAGVYTFTWTETNGICVDDDDVVITFYMGTDAEATTMATLPDISTITGTPVIIATSADYDDLTGTDPSILVDALIEYNSTGTFPTGATIFKVMYQENGGGFTNVPVINGAIGDKSSMLLSEILGGAYPLAGHSNLTVDFEIYIDGIDAAVVIPVKISTISYMGTFDEDCYAELAVDDFTVTFADGTVALTSGPNDACYAEPVDNPTNFTITVTYPTIANLDTDIKANALITSDVALPTNTKIDWSYNSGASTGTYTLLAPTSSIYLSEIVGGSAPYPLQGNSGADTWALTLVDFAPGTFNLDIVGIAQLLGTDYGYDTTEVKIVKVGALNVVTDIMPGVNPDSIFTVSGAPIIVPITVTYPDLTSSGQNIDPSVLTDAEITGLTNNVAGFPAGAKIIDIKYDGTSVPGFTGYTITTSPFLLSTALGNTATALVGHSGRTINWELTIADVNTPNVVTTTVKAIAYVEVGGCHSEMNTESFTAVWADLPSIVASSVPIVCEGTTVTGSNFTITYPVIAQNPLTILSDAEITVDELIPDGTIIKWGYNAPATNSYTVSGDWTAGTIKKLSEIVGSPAPTPLNGHSGLTVTWNFEFVGLGALTAGNTYLISVQPIATLNSTDYDLSDANTPVTQAVEIYKVPDATISNNDLIYSGGTYTFSVAAHSYGVSPKPSYSWISSVPDSTTFTTSSIRNPQVTFIYPFTGSITLTCTVNNGVCTDTKTFTVTVLPNQIVGQVKYYNSQESPMPSPFMTNYNGMDVPDYFYVSIVPDTFNIEEDDPYWHALEVVKVEEYYKESGPTKSSIQGFHPVLTADDYYEAAFGFYTNVDPTKEYRILVWDGGYYDEYGLLGSGYLGQNWTWNNWGGVNATDALLVQKMTVQLVNSTDVPPPANNVVLPYLADADYTDSYAFDVANVNSVSGITSLDALLIQRRAVGLLQKFTNNKPNFAVAGLLSDSAKFNKNQNFGTKLPDIAFNKLNLENYNWSTLAYQHAYQGAIIPGLGNKYLNIYYDAVGDINASYVPQYGGFKIAPTMELIYENDLTVAKGQEITLPVTLDAGAELGALSLGLNYRNDLIEVLGTNYGEDFASVDQNAGTVRVAWAATEGASFSQGDPVVILTVRIKGDIPAGTRLFELDGFTELADVSAQVIGDVNFKTSALTTSVEGAGALNVSNYPNPFANTTTINYSLPEAGAVKLVVYNKMGQLVKTFVDEYQSEGVYTVNVNSSDLMGQGVYYYKLEVKGESRNYSSTNNLVLIK